MRFAVEGAMDCKGLWPKQDATTRRDNRQTLSWLRETAFPIPVINCTAAALQYLHTRHSYCGNVVTYEEDALKNTWYRKQRPTLLSKVAFHPDLRQQSFEVRQEACGQQQPVITPEYAAQGQGNRHE